MKKCGRTRADFVPVTEEMKPVTRIELGATSIIENRIWNFSVKISPRHGNRHGSVFPSLPRARGSIAPRSRGNQSRARRESPTALDPNEKARCRDGPKPMK